MATEQVIDCDTPDPDHLTPRDYIEAECRQRMATLALMQVRGFDTAKAKADKRAELDMALDDYNRS